MTIERKPCKRCKGEGEVRDTRDYKLGWAGGYRTIECGVCLGTGLDESADAYEGEI